jgi:hypothetical protein
MSSGNSFIDAIIRGETEKAKSLIANGEDVNARDDLGNSALSWAAIRGNIEIVKALLAVPGIKVNDVNKDGTSAIILAASNNNVEVVQALLEANAGDNNGGSALREAAIRGNIETVQVLIVRPEIEIEVNLTNELDKLVDDDPDNENLADIQTLVRNEFNRREIATPTKKKSGGECCWAKFA